LTRLIDGGIIRASVGNNYAEYLYTEVAMVSGKYLYKVCLDTAVSVTEFVRVVSGIKGNISIVSGDKRINAKSVLGVLYARVAWDDVYVESDSDIWWEIRKFIEE